MYGQVHVTYMCDAIHSQIWSLLNETQKYLLATYSYEQEA